MCQSHIYSGGPRNLHYGPEKINLSVYVLCFSLRLKVAKWQEHTFPPSLETEIVGELSWLWKSVVATEQEKQCVGENTF